jgi:predicted deacylase
MVTSKMINLRTLASGASLPLRVYTIKGRDPTAKTAYIQSSMHGSEVQGNAVIAHLLEHFATSPPEGDVVLVPNANPYAVNQKGAEYTMGRFDPTTGDNWNRAYWLPDVAEEDCIPNPHHSSAVIHEGNELMMKVSLPTSGWCVRGRGYAKASDLGR